MNQNFRDKMYDYEVPPSSKVWDELSAALDSGSSRPFAKKLFDYEQVPPENNWASIVSAISVSTIKDRIPFIRKYRIQIRYSIAAAAILFFVFTGSRFFDNNADNQVTDSRILQNNMIPGIPTQENINNITQKNSDQEKDNESKVEGKSHYNEVAFVKHAPRQPVSISLPSSGIDRMSFTGDLLPRVAIRNSVISLDESLDKYMIYRNAEGDAIRMSKKLYNLFSCAESDRNCRQRILQMQEKIAAYALTADFTGVVELLSNLKEN